MMIYLSTLLLTVKCHCYFAAHLAVKLTQVMYSMFTLACLNALLKCLML